jgi:hypothetical protein
MQPPLFSTARCYRCFRGFIPSQPGCCGLPRLSTIGKGWEFYGQSSPCSSCKHLYDNYYMWCPFCGAASDRVGRLPPIGDLQSEIPRLEDRRNYPRIGEACLDALIRPNQEYRPDKVAQYLETELPAVVARKFGASDAGAVTSLLRNKYLNRSEWGNWPVDIYVRLIVLAYMLNPECETLPYPFREVSNMFRSVAVEAGSLLQKQAEREKPGQIAVIARDGPLKKEVAALQGELADHKRRMSEQMAETRTLDNNVLGIIESEDEDDQSKLHAIRGLMFKRSGRGGPKQLPPVAPLPNQL